MLSRKETKVLLFSGGSDSVLISYLYKPDLLVYVNMHTRYSEEEISKKLKTISGGEKVRIKLLELITISQMN